MAKEIDHPDGAFWGHGLTKEQLSLNLIIRWRERNKEEADAQVHTLKSGCDNIHLKNEIAKS